MNTQTFIGFTNHGSTRSVWFYQHVYLDYLCTQCCELMLRKTNHPENSTNILSKNIDIQSVSKTRSYALGRYCKHTNKQERP